MYIIVNGEENRMLRLRNPAIIEAEFRLARETIYVLQKLVHDLSEEMKGQELLHAAFDDGTEEPSSDAGLQFRDMRDDVRDGFRARRGRGDWRVSYRRRA